MAFSTQSVKIMASKCCAGRPFGEWGKGISTTTVDQEAMEDGTMYTPTAVPGEVFDLHGDNVYKAEKWARFLTYSASSRYVGVEGIEDFNYNLEEVYGLPSRKIKGLYAGTHVFDCLARLDKRLVEYHFALLPSQDISGIREQQHIASVRTLDGVFPRSAMQLSVHSTASSLPQKCIDVCEIETW